MDYLTDGGGPVPFVRMIFFASGLRVLTSLVAASIRSGPAVVFAIECDERHIT
jgi:hypothetical protein